MQYRISKYFLLTNYNFGNIIPNNKLLIVKNIPDNVIIFERYSQSVTEIHER